MSATLSSPSDDEIRELGAEKAEEAFDRLSLGAIQSVAHRQLVGSTILACVIAAFAAFAAVRSMGPPQRMLTAIDQPGALAASSHIEALRQQR
jgi:hypothetical protein